MISQVSQISFGSVADWPFCHQLSIVIYFYCLHKGTFLLKLLNLVLCGKQLLWYPCNWTSNRVRLYCLQKYKVWWCWSTTKIIEIAYNELHLTAFEMKMGTRSSTTHSQWVTFVHRDGDKIPVRRSQSAISCDWKGSSMHINKYSKSVAIYTEIHIYLHLESIRTPRFETEIQTFLHK